MEGRRSRDERPKRQETLAVGACDFGLEVKGPALDPDPHQNARKLSSHSPSSSVKIIRLNLLVVTWVYGNRTLCSPYIVHSFIPY